MEASTSIKALLFLHMVLIVLVTRSWFVRIGDGTERIAMARRSVVFWLASLFAVVAAMLLTATIMTFAYTRNTQAPDTMLFWGVMVAVGAVAAGFSGYLLNARLKRKHGA